jgi:hypothetical protein
MIKSGMVVLTAREKVDTDGLQPAARALVGERKRES